MPYTTTELVTSIKTRAAMPSSNNTFTTTKILALADEEIRTYIVPYIQSAREFYFAYDVDTAINATGIYEIPSRAIGGKLVNACLLNGNDRLDLVWLTEESLTNYTQSPQGVSGLYLKRNQVFLVPQDGGGYTTLRQQILIRPGTLIETTAASQITAIDTNTNTLTFASLPSTFTTALSYDIIQANPHFDHIEIDKTASSITSTTMVFSSLSSRIAVGDWVSIKETSPIVQVPVELQPILSQKVANIILEAQGDLQRLEAGRKTLDQMEEMCTPLFTPRIEKEAKMFVSRNGLLRRV